MGGMNLAGTSAGVDAWRKAQRILAIRLDNMGDVLMTTPALRALRTSAPCRHITLLAGGAGPVLAPFLPEVDEVITARGPWMPGVPPTPGEFQATVERLREGNFDAAVIFTVYSQSALPAALLCWLAGIPLRLAHVRENPYHLLTDWVSDPEPHEILRHEVRRQLDLVATVGAHTSDTRLSFHLRAEDQMRAAVALRRVGVDPMRPYAVIHPGASAPSRRYPPEGFAAVVDRLADEEKPDEGLQLVFTGDPSECELVDAIRALAGRATVSLAGELDLGELAGVLATASVLIANNTGPVHLAAALGTPVVDLYALTNPQHAPWKVPSRVLYEDVPCRYCYRSVCPQQHHACLRLLDPQRVARAAHELLSEGAEYATLALPARASHER